jgi:hypothetical protein
VVFNLAGVAADQRRGDVIGQIAGHSEFPSIQRGVTQTIESIFGDEFKRDEIASGRADNHFRVGDSHSGIPLI